MEAVSQVVHVHKGIEDERRVDLQCTSDLQEAQAGVIHCHHRWLQ